MAINDSAIWQTHVGERWHERTASYERTNATDVRHQDTHKSSRVLDAVGAVDNCEIDSPEMAFSKPDLDFRVFMETRNVRKVSAEKFTDLDRNQAAAEYDATTERNLRFIRGQAHLPKGISKKRQLQIALAAFEQTHRKAS